MPLFVAIFSEPLCDAVMELAQSGPVESAHPIDDHALAIRSFAQNPQVLGDYFGMNDTPPSRSGIVFKLNGAYFGFQESGLWDWLEENRYDPAPQR